MISCIAIDDEPLALRKLGDYIKRTPFLELESSCSSALEAMRVLSEKEIDLMFIDINMPDLSGMDFVKSLVRKPMIIFTTAYSEFALEGFKVDATDYLLKPFNYQDFLHAADKARLQHELFSRPLNRSEEGETPDSLFVKADYKMIRIDFRDILYIEDKANTPGFSENQPPVMTLLSLKAIEERLPTNRSTSASLLYRTSRQSEGSCSQPDHFAPDTYIPWATSTRITLTDF
ncbi:MAG: LytR/AlgR family response regulator transcription factor [Butyricimonas paravirosa]